MNKIVRTHLLAILLLCLTLMSRGSAANEYDASWVVSFSVLPSQTSLWGYKAEDINNEFLYIEALNCQLSSLEPYQCQQVADSGGAFELVLDQNQDGNFEVWSVAFAKLKTGRLAKVLIIREEATGKLLNSFIVDSNNSFSALYFYQGRVLWGMCLHCDVLADVSWQEERFQLSWQSELEFREEVQLVAY